ncbi:MAG: sporulation protein YunB [Christensenellales bacterium]|jgi:sporulation protein YunB
MKKLSVRKKIIIWFGIIAAVIITAILIIDANLKPAVLSLSEGRVRSLATNAMNEAVLENISSVEYDDLVKVLQDASGRVTMLQANTMRMSELASNTALMAQELLSQMGEQGLEIPLGTAIGGQLFSGKGPKVRVSVIPVGSVVSSFSSRFESAGINQTRHRIFITLTSVIRVVVPNAEQTVKVDIEVLVSETLIIGEVPDSFVDVNDKDDMLNLIPDAP